MKALEGDFVGVIAERDVLAKKIHSSHQSNEVLEQQLSAKVAELKAERKEKVAEAWRVKALEEELAGVKGERDAQAKEKGEAQKAVEDLKQQVSAKGAELEKERKKGEVC